MNISSTSGLKVDLNEPITSEALTSLLNLVTDTTREDFWNNFIVHSFLDDAATEPSHIAKLQISILQNQVSIMILAMYLLLVPIFFLNHLMQFLDFTLEFTVKST